MGDRGTGGTCAVAHTCAAKTRLPSCISQHVHMHGAGAASLCLHTWLTWGQDRAQWGLVLLFLVVHWEWWVLCWGWGALGAGCGRDVGVVGRMGPWLLSRVGRCRVLS